MIINENEIEAAVDYIFAEEQEKVETPTLKNGLKIRVVEGNNGTYYLEDNGIRLERKNAYVLFESKQELDAWTTEFNQVFELTK